MSALMYQREQLREEAVRFAAGVHRNPAVAADQQLLWYGFTGDYAQLLETVELRFLNRPDGADDTHARFKELVRSYNERRRTRSRLYGDVCILFIGHADLFNRFERLGLMNDGRPETRHQILEWRNSVRNVIMAAIRAVLSDFFSAIGRLEANYIIIPQTLDDRNLDFIARTCFPGGVDPDNVMAGLAMYPPRVRHRVLPTLKRKQARFQQLANFLAHYFGQVASGEI